METYRCTASTRGSCRVCSDQRRGSTSIPASSLAPYGRYLRVNSHQRVPPDGEVAAKLTHQQRNSLPNLDPVIALDAPPGVVELGLNADPPFGGLVEVLLSEDGEFGGGEGGLGVDGG